MKLGRLPFRVSARRVNCETARISPPASRTLRFILPSASAKTRRPATFSASQSASGSPSSFATPTRSKRPGPISEIKTSSTETEACFTRWRTIFKEALKGLAALVAGLYLVPVAYLLLGRMPAEEDDAAIPFVGEVQEAHVEVFEEDTELPDALYGQIEVVRLDAVLGAYLAATVRGGGFEYGLELRRLFTYLIAVNADIFEELLQLGQKSVCLLDGEESGERELHVLLGLSQRPCDSRSASMLGRPAARILV